MSADSVLTYHRMEALIYSFIFQEVLMATLDPYISKLNYLKEVPVAPLVQV